MTENIIDKSIQDITTPESFSPLVAYLCSEEVEETGAMFECGGGFVAKVRW